MNLPLVPQNALGAEGGLLSALAIGFLFGFALERAGFGNARKLAAQFYLHDMTVFKVMFTAIITAMSGLYALAAWGLVDLSQVWINPTFLGPQLAGGFLLGAGFIISGLCPGTGFVSLASGKLDALYALGGVFLGTLLFGVGLETLPFLKAFYTAPAAGTLLLHDLFGLPAPWLALAVVLMALGCFIAAERVEALVARRRAAGSDSGRESTPVPDRRGKFVLAGSLALLCLAAGLTPAAPPAPASPDPPRIMAASDLAELLIQREAGWLLLDLRHSAGAEAAIPGALAVADPALPPPQVGEAPTGTRVLLIGEVGEEAAVPEAWPRTLDYYWLDGGMEAWRREVQEPRPTPAADASTSERERALRRAQIAAWFSGSEAAPVAAAPPAAGSGTARRKKAGGGC
ncbi:MAG: YeeE/YedE thiosulfate transporter family protein [bacterium]|jgi:hypothetical protein|nr:YeeE/YedE thiosulfate transporter family protein [bacterium]